MDECAGPASTTDKHRGSKTKEARDGEFGFKSNKEKQKPSNQHFLGKVN